jgi:segregation and condensation protein A
MAEPAAVIPIAKVYGEPMLEVPYDLYIPPDALEVILDQFEGPLDLLLYLIRKENINVLDIPMARLTAQYLEYVEIMRARSLELAAEYLLMAALLIEIKSRMLLPRPAAIALEEDPRAELVRRLLEYEQMKLAAQRLNELPQSGRDFSLVQVLFDQAVTERLPDVNPEDLRTAWLGLLTRAAMNRHHRITREQLMR